MTTRVLPFIKTLFDLRIVEIKWAWRAGLVVTAAYFLNVLLLQGKAAEWTMFSAVVCLQSTAGSTIRRSKHRLLGTILGTALAIALDYISKSDVIFMASFVFLAAVLSLNKLVRSYFLYILFLTFALITVYNIVEGNSLEFALTRIKDVSLGVLVGSAGALLFLPDYAKKQFKADMPRMLKENEKLFLSVLSYLENGGAASREIDFNQQKFIAAGVNQTARIRIAEMYHEPRIKKALLKRYRDFILSQERVHYALIHLFYAIQSMHSSSLDSSILKELCREVATMHDIFVQYAKKFSDFREEKIFFPEEDLGALLERLQRNRVPEIPAGEVLISLRTYIDLVAQEIEFTNGCIHGLFKK